MKYIKEFKLFETLKSYEIDVVVKKLEALFSKYALSKKLFFDKAPDKYYTISSDRDHLKRAIDEYKDKKHYMTKGMMKHGYKQEDLISSAEEKLNDFKYGDIFIITNFNTPELSKDLLNVIDSSGYFVASIDKKLNISDKGKIKEDLSKCDRIFISIEPNYDTQVNFKGDYLFHTTDIKNLEKIKKYGLIPKSKNTRSFYPERIYLAPDEKYMNSIKSQLQLDKDGEYVCLKIKNFDDLKLYRDVRFKGGFYTYDNIKPEYIEII